jgi:hypothetical protein
VDPDGHRLQIYSGKQIVIKDAYFAPFATRSIDFDWRMGLKQGDFVDVQDAQGVWY